MTFDAALPTVPSDGLLIVGHGTREPRGVEAFAAVVRRVAQLEPRVAVESGLLELAEPSIAMGVRRLLERGVRRMAVTPLLLFAAEHAKHDVPAAVREALAQHGDVEVRQAPVLGLHEHILRLSARRFDESLAAAPSVPSRDTLLVMVGRGSRDSEALAAMRKFAELRAARSPVARVETCFLAMAEPNLATTLERAATRGFRRVVVQPHLLFPGELLDRIGTTMAQQRIEHPHVEWVTVGPLDDIDVLARVVIERGALPSSANAACAS